ncbi:MAG TPA: hypothetical protein VJ397_02760 [Thermoplasmata archaeon]|nr:hypothetical protein [Thermoplasmata archaeon]
MNERASVLALLMALAVLTQVPVGVRAEPAMTLSPTSGPPGTSVTVTGSGFFAGAAVDVFWYTMEGNRVSGSGFLEVGYRITGALADGSGQWTASFVVPYDLGGPPHRLVANVSGDDVAEASFTLTRQSSITPTSGPEGTIIEFQMVGGGWTQYDNNIAITYDNAFLGFACSFNSGGNISVYIQASGGVGPHLITVYPAIYYGPSNGPTPWKHPVLNVNDLPVRYEIQQFTFEITESTSSVRTYLRGTDLKPITAPDTLVIPTAPAVPILDGTPQLTVGNGGNGIVGTPLPYALAGFPPNTRVDLKWNSVVGVTKIDEDDNKGWVMTPTNSTLTSVTTDGQGRALASVPVPSDFGGDHLIEALVAGEVKATATWRLVPSFTADLSADGSQVIIHARGLGYEKYTAAWEILYDNRLMGWMSAFTSRGSVDVTVPIVGTPGTHSIDIYEGTGGWPYLNMQQSPWPWEPAVRFAFTIQAPAPATQATAVNVPLWLTGAAIVAAVAVGFLAGRVRRRTAAPSVEPVQESDA